MNAKGPYIAAALLCERVLREIDGGISVIRLMDTIAIDLLDEAADPFPLQYGGHALVSLKSGDYVGPMTLRLEVRNPDNELAKPPLEQILEFKGGEHGTNSIFYVSLEVLREGLYYFNVFLGDRLVTQMPLRVRINRKKAEPMNS